MCHTQNRFIVQRYPTMSPPYAGLIYGYTELGQHIIFPWCARHTHPHTCSIVWRALPVSPTKCQSRLGAVLSWMTWEFTHPFSTSKLAAGPL
ncbi:hypothetical protein O181_087308 [Austropuccinia psidii MF-1]|uniref:Uncharacterized protein n=1 Tax=Austropuccinia psidii MF-1 TaxID=1389203 RepID=A0A9Q3P0X1_9BASI|nr:hypothetical protein [Austropuccinia psidii MF-1]